MREADDARELDASLMEEYRPELVAFFNRNGPGCDPEELAAKTLDYYRRYRLKNEIRSPYHLLMRMAAYRLTDWIRTKGRVVSSDEPKFQRTAENVRDQRPDGRAPDDIISERDCVQKALAELSPEDRALAQALAEDLEYEEIAAAHRTSEATIRQRVRRMRDRLAHFLLVHCGKRIDRSARG